MSMIIQSIKPKLRAKASSLLSDYTLANNVWRNVFNMEEDLKFTVAPNGNNVNEEQQVEFQKLMLERKAFVASSCFRCHYRRY